MFKFIHLVKSFLSNHFSEGFILFAAIILTFLIYFFIRLPLQLGGARFFLENKNYKDTGIGRILFCYQYGYVKTAARILFFKTLYLYLWSLTIVGGIIKGYEYRMVSYIAAENPAISRKDAFQLSKQMMKGNKWKTFLLDMSFLGWYFLNIFTFGLLGFLFVNPYKETTNTELYFVLRKQQIEDKEALSDLMNDSWLEKNL